MSNVSKSLDKLSPLQRALLVVEKMESKLQALERAQTESIAIIGMGCRFPGGANNLETYWQLLRDGVDAITEVPPERWDIDTYYDPDPEVPGKMYTRWGGFLRQEEVERFDPEFFGIAPREAKGMDPQQRMLLEVGWEALENAAQSIEKLSGSRTGVFVGVCYNDYMELQLQCGDASKIDAYLASGNEHSMLAGRLSYTLGLQGPSMTIDTSCSSSLVAVHLACQNLRNKECNLALAGGVNLILSPYITIGVCKARMLAADGRCKTFDQAADGFVRGEGCGILVLKRLAEAVADGNNILAVIRGSAVNQDGASSGLTAPNELAQEAVIREALFNAGVKPSEVSYVEAHGTGTSLGDPIEVQALAAVLGESREPDNRFMMGSVKTNLGHLESAAGIAGLIKVVLALQYEEIPPHLHFSEPNPYINWRDIPVVIPTERLPWPAGNGRRIAGVSSFGFSGTNAHVILEEAPISRPVQAEVERPLQLCTLSARSEQALQELAVSYSHHLEANPKESIADLCFTANAGRSHFEHRVAVVAESAQQLHEKLTAFSAGKEAVGLLQGQTKGAKRPKLAFLFTGQGSQYIGMGRELYATQPTFRKALDHCEEILKPYLEQPLTGYLFPHDGEASKLNETWVTQPALFALEYALAQLWQSWGIKPDVVLGHSVGEYVAACIAGVFSLEDGLKLIATRGKLMGALPPNGAMAAVMAPESVVTRKIEAYGDDLSIAAYNGPQLLVISGEREALEQVLREFDQEGITSQRLAVSHAFHSSLMEPMLQEFEKVLKEVQYSEPQIPLVSNVTGEFLTKEQVTPEYFLKHIRSPVRFAPSIEFLAKQGYPMMLEVGPQPVLLGMARRCVSGDVDGKTKWLPSLRRGKGDWEQLLESLGNAYVSGVKVDWSGFDKDYPRRKISLPTYPFQRQRYWIEADKKASTRREGLSHPTENPLLGYRLPLPHPSFECLLSPTESLGFLKDHRVYGKIVVPGAAYLEMGLAAAKEAIGTSVTALEDVVIREPLLLEDVESGKSQTVQVHLFPQVSGGGATLFEIFSLEGSGKENGESAWRLHASGKVRSGEGEAKENEVGPVILRELQERCKESLSVKEYYERLQESGVEYGPGFQGIERLWKGNGEVLGQIRLAAPLLSESGNYQVHPALLDACFQLLGASLSTAGEPSAESGVYMPIGVERIQLYARPGVSLWCHAVLHKGDGKLDPEVLRGDLRLLDESGQVVAVIEGLTAKRASREALHRATQRDVQDWLYEVAWRPQIGEGHQPPDYLPTPSEISPQLVAQLEELKGQSSLAAYGKVLPELEALSAAYVVRALRELGWEFPPKQRFSIAELTDQLGIVSQHQRLLGRLLDMLAEERILRSVGSEWEVVSKPEFPDPEAQQRNLLKKYPSAEAELTLLGRCGKELAEVLTGECDPLQLLFPEGDLTTTTQLYQDSPGAKVMNALVGKAVIAALEHLPEGRRVRILEIGAGTGGTTSYLLPHLPADRTDYVFTDLSPLFTTKAQEKFADYPFVRTQLLDIEKAPKEQGFGEHQYDLIVAANVLHATRDLRETLGHVQQLLAPGGMLVLLEATVPQRWVDLIFGLLEGWWRFADHELRPAYSLLSASQWQELLESEGFTQAVPIALEQEREGVSPQAVIVAQRAAVKPEETESKAWLILADAEGTGEGLAALLREKGEQCTLVYPGKGYERLGEHEFRVDPTDFKPLFQELAGPDNPSLYGVVHLWSLDTVAAGSLTGTELAAASQRGCGTTLHLVQSLLQTEFSKPPHLILVTRGAQAVGEESAVSGVAQSPLWGMGKVIALEYPELSCVRIDLDPEAKVNATQVLFEEIWSETPEDQVAFRDDVRHVARLVRHRDAKVHDISRGLEVPSGESFQLEISSRGNLDNLVLQPKTRRQPGPGELEIRVHAAGLNFLDVMNALGALPFEASSFGGECAGEIVAVGPDVQRFEVGDEVIALAPGSFSSFVTCPSASVAPKPKEMSFEEAATISTVFLTAYYAFHHIAKLSKGERVLIHSAAGGVGLAAVQLAQQAGAEIFATAGSEEKREFLKSLGVQHVMNSRTLDFADEVMEITGGEGVDIVLNALTGEYIPKGLSLLRAGGRFLEIGKTEIWTDEEVSQIKQGISYSLIDLVQLLLEDPALIQSMFAELMKDFESGRLKPLPYKSFPIQESVSAFRYMQQAKHIGKIVLSQEELIGEQEVAHAVSIRSDATYLITGGLGGLGLEVGRWLVEQGARHLVLIGRGEASAAAGEVISALEGSGAQVKVRQADVSREKELAQVLSEIQKTMPPLKGVIHSAGVLEDGILLKQSWDRFAKVFAPKVQGAWNLHAMTQDMALDLFILFSSQASLLGNRGQGNHAAACAFEDGLAHYRRAQGLPALSINWGAWSEIGAAAERGVEERLARQGTGVGTISPQQGLQVLDRLLRQSAVQVGVIPVNWSEFTRGVLSDMESPFLSDLLRESSIRANKERASKKHVDLLKQLEKADPSEQRALVLDYLKGEVAHVLGLDGTESLGSNKRLMDVGLDSLMAVELRNRLEVGLGVEHSLPATLIFKYPTIEAIAGFLAQEVLHLELTEESPFKLQKDKDGLAQDLAEIDQLTDEEASHLLAEKLKSLPLELFLGERKLGEGPRDEQ